MKKINVGNIVTIISIVIILFVTVIFNFWYSQNDLRFVSKDKKEQIADWLNINKDYSNTLELISVNQSRSGFSGHDKYDELIFKISKEEYEKNNLNYSQSFDSPEVQLRGKKRI